MKPLPRRGCTCKTLPAFAAPSASRHLSTPGLRTPARRRPPATGDSPEAFLSEPLPFPFPFPFLFPFPRLFPRPFLSSARPPENSSSRRPLGAHPSIWKTHLRCSPRHLAPATRLRAPARIDLHRMMHATPWARGRARGRQGAGLLGPSRNFANGISEQPAGVAYGASRGSSGRAQGRRTSSVEKI